MPVLGADPGELDALANRMATAGAHLQNLASQLNQCVNSLPWEGVGADTFRSDWPRRYAPAIAAAATSLQDMSSYLHRKASEQRAASAADAPSAGSGVALPASAQAALERAAEILLALAPAQVVAFLERTDPAVLAALMRDDPSALGNTNGVPIDLREQANRAALDQAISEAQARGDTQQIAFLESLKQQIDQPDTNLLYFDPSQDHYAVAIGNVATAQHVAVLVPGVSDNADQDMINGWIPYSRTIYSASNGDGGSTAVIMWKGYQDPTIPEAPSMDYAVSGASALTSFCNGLGLGSGQSLTLIGHSYGSVVTGLALSNDGLRPTNVIALGSPGMGVDNVSELNLQPGQFFDEAAPGDPITALGYFGTDPSSMTFGGTRMSTGGTGAFPSLSIHSSYFDAGSESMRNIADVVTGHYSQVQAAQETPGDYVSVGVHFILNPFQDPLDAVARGYTGPGSGIISTVVHVRDSGTNLIAQGTEVVTNDVVSAGTTVVSDTVNTGSEIVGGIVDLAQHFP